MECVKIGPDLPTKPITTGTCFIHHQSNATRQPIRDIPNRPRLSHSSRRRFASEVRRDFSCISIVGCRDYILIIQVDIFSLSTVNLFIPIAVQYRVCRDKSCQIWHKLRLLAVLRNPYMLDMWLFRLDVLSHNVYFLTFFKLAFYNRSTFSCLTIQHSRLTYSRQSVSIVRVDLFTL